jgi:hypothetical protein
MLWFDYYVLGGKCVSVIFNKRTTFAKDVRALRTPQVLPVHDGEEVMP